ncbi:Guanine nucleotide-binding protein G(I)/G(S)/G(O) subunit gamma-13 [Oryzias melastigma]|nr:Guanine nucleotide-binding protein G(I)/G(S)/G(O) subunit gamma-13 [Oryzias melastigma]
MKEPDVVAERAAFASPSQDGVEVPAAVLFLAPEPRGVLWEKLRAKAGPVERGQPAPRALVQVPTEPKKAGVALAAPRFSIISAADCDEGRLCNTKCYSTLGKNTAALCGSAASAGSILQADSRPEPGLFNDSNSPHQTAAMDEMDLPQMKKEVESLKYQLAFKREKSSKTVTDLVKWIEDGVPEDPFLNPELMKNNPWVEKGKCVIL